MSGISPVKLQVLAQLQGIVIFYDPEIVLPFPDGMLSLSYRLVMGLVRDCLTKCKQGRISSEYLEHLKKNIRTLVQQTEERSQSEDMDIFKEMTQKVLLLLEYPAPSLEHQETPDGDSKKGKKRNIADPNTSQPGINRDLIEETTEPANADGGIWKTPEIHESISAVTGSLIPVREPCKSDYTQIKEISSGTYGAVHLVRHKDTNHVFAMKKQSRRDLYLYDNLEPAYLERDIAIFSDCPFVVSTYCSFTTKQHLCMVMEFAAGGDCGNLINMHGRLPLPLAQMYLAETVLGVEYLHNYGIVHRDLKPENLMISSTGHIKITDFGLSKLGLMRPTSEIYKASTKDITREFRDDGITGTFYYVAPEVILQKGFGRPIDWWSIGIILHKFLTGHVLFKGCSKKEIFDSIIRDSITWKYFKSAPPAYVRDIIIELLRKKPERRLGTGGANEIKNHPFFSDIEFENLQNQKPPFQPSLISEVDTGYFDSCKRRPKHSDSDEGVTSKGKRWPKVLNYESSSQRLFKLYATRMIDNEDRKSSPEGSVETSPKPLDVQKESSPTGNDGDNQIFTMENNKSSSPTSSVEKKRKSALKLKKEQKSEIAEEREPRRRSIFRRIISSCRRGLSRAARTIRESSIFTLNQRGTYDLTKTQHLQI